MSLGGVYSSRRGPREVEMVADGEGFGFHMYTNKQWGGGQYIKSVTAGGVADRAGIRVGDHIIEVDGTNVEIETHGQVVERIKNNPDEPKRLLICDRETEDLFKKQKKRISSGSFVEISRSPSMSSSPSKEGLKLPSMSEAKPKGKKNVKGGDWATKTAMFNDL